MAQPLLPNAAHDLFGAILWRIDGRLLVWHPPCSSGRPMRPWMRRNGTRQVLVVAASILVAAGFAVRGPAEAQSRADTFNDTHFHLTNYVQRGIDARQFLKIMGNRVARSTLFGIPLQQQWSYANSGDFAPTYYLQTDAPLYY